MRSESDFGTDETRRQSGGADYGYTADGGKIAKARYQNYFDYLLHRGTISSKQWDAGERLRRDAMKAGCYSYIKSSADHTVRGNSSDEPAEFIVMARERLTNALASLDFSQRNIINIYVVDDGYLKTRSGWQCRQNIATLRNALDLLARFYRV